MAADNWLSGGPRGRRLCWSLLREQLAGPAWRRVWTDAHARAHGLQTPHTSQNSCATSETERQHHNPCANPTRGVPPPPAGARVRIPPTGR